MAGALHCWESWLHCRVYGLCSSRPVEDAVSVSVPTPAPNKGMELTAYSDRSILAPAFGSSSCLALGASGAVEKTTTQRRWRGQNLHIGEAALERFEACSDMYAIR